jgi:hypothetical protein
VKIRAKNQILNKKTVHESKDGGWIDDGYNDCENANQAQSVQDLVVLHPGHTSVMTAEMLGKGTCGNGGSGR